MIDTKNAIKMADKKVKPHEDVTVYGTGTSKHLPAGKEITVHKAVADTLIASGKATEIPGSENTKTKGGKV